MRNKEIIGTFTHHLKEPVFYIPHTMRNITLSKTDPMETIVIRTSSKLDITVLYGKREWIRSDYSQAKKTLSIHLDMSDAADHSQMRIAVSDESYSRKEFINVKYLADSAGSTSCTCASI